MEIVKIVGKILFAASVVGCCFPAMLVWFGVYGALLTLLSVIYLGVYISK
ncbi:hypothetical protein [Phocaeicola plebeius]